MYAYEIKQNGKWKRDSQTDGNKNLLFTIHIIHQIFVVEMFNSSAKAK